jgi:hypothetical protein
MDERITSEERIKVRNLVETWGEAKVVHEFGVNVESLLRVLADMNIRRGTLVLVRQGIEKMSKMKPSAK